MNARVLVEARDLHRDYSLGSATVHALAGVDLDVHEGEFVAVVGVSGSGKSTLLHLLGGLDTPSSGSVRVGGRDLARASRRELTAYRREGVGFVFQDFHLLGSMTAQENVALALTFRGIYGERRRTLAARALQRVGLGARLLHRPRELSGGEQQRVALARAIVHSPPLVLADEPTGNLDRATSREIVDLLCRLRREQGIALVMVTHDEDIAARLADRVLHLEDGRLVSAGEAAP